jgi:hypothetical protein
MLSMGYVHEYCPDHPRCSRSGYYQQHRLVAEIILRRQLSRAEVVHHEDENKTNNAPENLWLFPDQAAHLRHHKADSLRYDRQLAERVAVLATDRGLSQIEAARCLDIAVSTLQAILRTHHIHWANRGESGLDEVSVREALRGRTTLEAAQNLGVNHQTLRNLFPGLLSKRASPGSLERHRGEIRSLASSIRAAALAERYSVNPATVLGAIRRWSQQEPGAWSEIVAFQQSRRGLGRPPRRKA